MNEDNEPPDGNEDPPNDDNIKKRKQYPKEVREMIWRSLEEAKIDGKLPHDAVATCAKNFGVQRKIVERVLDRGDTGLELGVLDFSDRRASNHKALKYNPQQLRESLTALPIELRGTYRDSAHNVGIPPSTFYEYTKKHGVFVPRTAALKPKLTQWHRLRRVEFVREKIDTDGIHYDPQFDTIHIDEKKTSMCLRKHEKYFVLPMRKYLIGKHEMLTMWIR
jgi:hypothetical protein